MDGGFRFVCNAFMVLQSYSHCCQCHRSCCIGIAAVIAVMSGIAAISSAAVLLFRPDDGLPKLGKKARGDPTDTCGDPKTCLLGPKRFSVLADLGACARVRFHNVAVQLRLPAGTQKPTCWDRKSVRSWQVGVGGAQVETPSGPPRNNSANRNPIS